MIKYLFKTSFVFLMAFYICIQLSFGGTDNGVSVSAMVEEENLKISIKNNDASKIFFYKYNLYYPFLNIVLVDEKGTRYDRSVSLSSYSGELIYLYPGEEYKAEYNLAYNFVNFETISKNECLTLYWVLSLNINDVGQKYAEKLKINCLRNSIKVN